MFFYEKVRKIIPNLSPVTLPYLEYYHKWMDDLRFYVLFNSTSVISGQWADDNERLCCETPFAVEKISPRAGLKLGTARSAGQRLVH